MFKKYKVLLSSVLAQVTMTTLTYLSTRVVGISKVGFITINYIVSGLIYTCINVFRKDLSSIKTTSTKDISTIALGVELPIIGSELCLMKMLEKQVVLPNAIFSCYPILNLVYAKCSQNVLYTSHHQNQIIIDKSNNIFLNKEGILELLGAVLYLSSVLVIYDAQKNNENHTEIVYESIIYACCAAFLESIAAHFTNKYGSKYGAEIIVQLGIIISIPLMIILSCLCYNLMDSMSFEEDYLNNSYDLVKACGLSILNLLGIFTNSYALSYSDNVGDTTLLLTITSNIYALLLEGFSSDHHVNNQVIVGTMMGIASCISLIFIHDKYGTNDYNGFIGNVIEKLTDFDRKDIIPQILEEWKNNKEIYNLINIEKVNELDLKYYNEISLLILSKILKKNFIIQNKDGENILVISANQDVDKLIIQTKYDITNFNNNVITLHDGTVEVSEYLIQEMELINNRNLVPILGENEALSN